MEAVAGSVLKPSLGTDASVRAGEVLALVHLSASILLLALVGVNALVTLASES